MRKRLLIFAILSVFMSYAWAQNPVSGVVTAEEDGSPLVGVSVLIMGTTTGAITNENGEYKLEVPDGARLLFSYIGYLNQEIDVGNQSVIDISLVSDATQLEEVVVTSLGIAREKMALGYSVQEVDGENFTQAREMNIANALEGRIAGVNVSNLATGPAGSSRVIIRGNASISGNNQPLYVVDGVPLDNTNYGQAGMWGGLDRGDGTASINPDDIENITVLKGANAGALYGSRASNGVILITTKKGKKGRGLDIEFNSNYVLETVTDNTDFQTEYGHGSQGRKPSNAQEGLDWGGGAWGAPLDGSMVYVADGSQQPYVNTFADGGTNLKKFYENGTTWTNTLALSGGGEKQTYRFAGSYMTHDSPMPNAGFDRYNISLATDGQHGNLNMSAKILYSNEEVKNRPWVSDSPGNAHQAVYRMGPSINVEYYKGDPEKPGAVWEEQDNLGLGKKIGDELLPWNNIWLQNPYWAAYQYETNDYRDRIIGHTQLKYDFTDWLWARVRLGMDWQTKQRHDVVPYGTSYQPRGSGREYEYRIRETNYEWMVGFNKLFGELGINAFVGGNAMHRTWQQIGTNSSNFNIPYFHAPSNGANQSFSYGYSEEGINSVFGSLELSWGGFIYLTGTARQDWFSTLNPETNSILYPSVGLSYVWSEQFTMPSWWTTGKLRASWAQVGGATSPYGTLLTYSLVGAGHLGGTYPLGAISQGVIPNPELVPLTSTEFEFGLDLGFANNRLGLDITYYKQTTTDDILDASISLATGFDGTKVNIGEMENSGIELLLSGTPARGAFTWDIALNFAYNQNKVVALSEGIERLFVEEPRTRQAYIYNIIGQPYSSIMGFYHSYYDANSNGQQDDGELIYSQQGRPIDSDTTKYLGQGVHPYTGGLLNTLTFKNFTLDFLIDFKFGADMYSGTNVRLTQWGLSKQSLEGREGDKTVQGYYAVGDGTYAPLNYTIPTDEISSYWGGYGDCSNYFIYDASFIKLRQITFGYSFPSSLLAKTPLTYLNLSFVARNLWLIHSNVENVDPESMYSSSNAQGMDYFGMPQTRSYGFNLRARF